MAIDLSHLLPSLPIGPQVVAEAKVQILVDAAAGTVKLHIEDHLGPFKGPTIDEDINPLHAMQVAAHGIGTLVGKTFGTQPK